MSFLTPLYLLGVLAVTLPVVFHMIRRTPHGRQEFSSVMFLEPSSPRTTNRSSIEHWLLLLLRAVAVCLLAFAFARPFFRLQDGRTVVSGDFRRVVLLLDTSASMRREGVWEEALDRAKQTVTTLDPADRLEVLAFDRRPHVLMDIEQWQSLDPSQRTEAVTRLFDDLSPSWAATDLGSALVEAAERLDDELEDEGPGVSRTLVVVSDLQEGSNIESLQSYQWPSQMTVAFETVGSDVSPDNAAAHPIHDRADSVTSRDVLVRVTNADGASRQQFSLRWSADGASSSEVVSVSVPPGKSRVVSVPIPAELGEASHLILEGDDHSFDNACFLSSSDRRQLKVVLVSKDTADDPEGMRYYLERALVETPDWNVNIQVDNDGSELVIGQDIDLAVITTSPTPEQLDVLRQYIAGGGTTLFIPSKADDLPALFSLMEAAPLEPDQALAEATIDGYVMLTDIDFSHPMFAALDQPQFSDFTTVRFWKHRQFRAESLPNLRVLAKFDDGTIAVGEHEVGEGRVVFLSSGWHPADSQLALSTKFVPMINGLLEDAAGLVTSQAQYVIGDEVDLSQLLPAKVIATSVLTPAGEEVAVAEESQVFLKTELPGRYRVLNGDSAIDTPPEFVVNLDPSESQTTPLSADTFRAMGVPMEEDNESTPSPAEMQRQLHNSELEQHQKVWRWLILLAMIVLIIETVFASRLARVS
ncbi:MAG: BatA domain-containing protein [Planctomycetaceae bacterium]|nr:BatA domain-containing protein [Planctomycetaceae bacterium]